MNEILAKIMPYNFYFTDKSLKLINEDNIIKYIKLQNTNYILNESTMTHSQ